METNENAGANPAAPVVNTGSNEETVTISKAELDAIKQKADQFPNVVARAKAAEEEARALKAPKAPEVAPPVINQPSLSSEDVDVKILESQGVDQESIDYLKKLSKINNTSVLAAQQDPIYKTFKANKEAEAKAQQATLGASKGSGQGSQKKTFNTPGISDDDHKKMWLEKQGR